MTNSGSESSQAHKFNRRQLIQATSGAAVLALLSPRPADAAAGIITTVVGGGPIGDGGPATAASLATPFAIGIDGANNVYVSDNYYHRVYSISSATGILTTIAGNGYPGSGGDGGVATQANLHFPYGIAVDRAGNVCIADGNNNKVRWVDRATGIITTVAGTGVAGFNGDNQPATSA
ncbi:MAG: hypothetical protein ABI693_33695, partial [Bryobacteraceae bacterium]